MHGGEAHKRMPLYLVLSNERVVAFFSLLCCEMLNFLSMYVSLPLFQLHGGLFAITFTVCMIQSGSCKANSI
jgi:hypothetical protein